MEENFNSRFVASLSTTFNEFCEVSSFDGIRFFKDKTTSKYLRILWVLTILAMILLANHMATFLYMGFIESPVRLIIETDHAVSARVLFPAVTFCPGTLYNHSKAEELMKSFTLPAGAAEENILENLDQMYTFTEPKFKYSSKKGYLLKTVMKLNNYTLERFFNETIWNCGEFFLRCRFQSRHINCSEIFLITKTHAGFCCSFNSQQSRNQVKQYKSNRHGLRQGLSVILNNVDFDAEHTNSNARKFQMLVHRPEAYPDFSTFRKTLHQNEAALLRYDPIETTYSKEIWKRLNIDQRSCTLFSETNLNLFQKYNRQNCFSECQAIIILQQCGCVPFNMFGPPTAPICDFEHVHCFSNNYEKNSMLQKQCKCYDSCEKVEYSFRLTSVSFDKAVEVADPFYDDFRQNLSIVHVFLQSQEYRRIRRDTVWNIVSLAGNLGNCFSVFVGISALSVVELLYFLTFVLRRNYKNSLNSNRKTLFKNNKSSDKIVLK